MNNNSIKTKIHNRFDIYVEHINGDVDKYTQYNIVLDNLYNTKFKSTNFQGGSWVNSLTFGSGTGEMDASRTTLFEPLGHKSTSVVYRTYNPDWRSGEVQVKITIEPEEHVGATLTEIGIGTKTSAYTHSLIKDSFGNPVAIHKTDTDKITIYATVYAELTDVDDIGIGYLSDNVFLMYMLGKPMNASYNGNYTLIPYNIDPMCDDWIKGVYESSVTYLGVILDESGAITQTLNLGITDYNGNDVRSITMGGRQAADYYYGCVVPIKGPNFEGITYSNQHVGVGNGVDTVFKIPTDYRGVKDCVVKVDNKVVEVKKNIIHGNNRIIGHVNVPSSFVKVGEGKYVTIMKVTGSSSGYYGYALRLYEINELGKITLKYTKKIGSANISSSNSKYMSHSIFEEINAITVKNGNAFELYNVNWETGMMTHIGNMSCGSTSSSDYIAYSISGTKYIAIEHTLSSTSYEKSLYEYSNNILTKVKDLTNIPSLFIGPNVGTGTLKGDYYCGNQLYKFDTSELIFKSIKTLPFEAGKGIVIAPFTIASTVNHPDDGTNYQQLIIKKCNSSWDVTETIEFLDKFPRSSSNSVIYLKENVFLIGSKEPHIVTFNPDTNEITYRKHASNLTSSNYDTGFYYASTMDIPNSNDFIYPFKTLAICTEQEVGSIEFSEPVAEDSVINIDFTLDYIPKNDSVTASFTTKLQWG